MGLAPNAKVVFADWFVTTTFVICVPVSRQEIWNMVENAYVMYEWALVSYHLQEFDNAALNSFDIVHLGHLALRIEIESPRIKTIL